MQTLIISCSLNPQSRSAKLALEAEKRLIERLDTREQLRHIDLRQTPLPPCDGHTVYDDPRVREMAKAVTLADAIIMAVPIYNYDVNAAAKNLIELTGRAWQDKVVGFLCAAGGKSSYMSVMSVANSLMLDFRCLILPRFIYTTGDDFVDDELRSPVIHERMDEMCDRLIAVTNAIGALART